MKVLKKGTEIQLSKNLNQKEFDCKCKNPDCLFALYDQRIFVCFQVLRETWKSPIRVTSGFRCQVHNRDVGGKERSFHLRGQALDLVPKHGDLEDFYRVAQKIFPFVLKYEKLGFCHCDVRTSGSFAP